MSLFRVAPFAPLLASLFIVGCASKPTVSEYQCRAGDWETIGYRDGTSGFGETRLLAHQEACGEFSIVPDRELYRQGHARGLASYCTADNGYQAGLSGKNLNRYCAQELREPFASAHADGYTLYVARRDVREIHAELEQLEVRLSEVRQEIVGVTTAQLLPDLTTEERIRLVAKLELLLTEQADLRAARPQLEDDLAQAEDDLDMLQQPFSQVSY